MVLEKNKEKINAKPIYMEKDGEVPVEIAIQYTTSYSENIYTFAKSHRLTFTLESQ